MTVNFTFSYFLGVPKSRPLPRMRWVGDSTERDGGRRGMGGLARGLRAQAYSSGMDSSEERMACITSSAVNISMCMRRSRATGKMLASTAADAPSSRM